MWRQELIHDGAAIPLTKKAVKPGKTSLDNFIRTDSEIAGSFQTGLVEQALPSVHL
jgi:hypothetical protein